MVFETSTGNTNAATTSSVWEVGGGVYAPRMRGLVAIAMAGFQGSGDENRVGDYLLSSSWAGTIRTGTAIEKPGWLRDGGTQQRNGVGRLRRLAPLGRFSRRKPLSAWCLYALCLKVPARSITHFSTFALLANQSREEKDTIVMNNRPDRDDRHETPGSRKSLGIGHPETHARAYSVPPK
ncbi:hypothetical protein CC78DRAFT_548397 [Lojkania enalia]|uniref:Uncharacterized protein n=1 Tax=Lojkania enalia TaxID=147567 RepID=A0A9P4JY47_9PLEO|nr:hypothetical protein CC78DRAFT_548397 [Didymosphaeria enalia]